VDLNFSRRIDRSITTISIPDILSTIAILVAISAFLISVLAFISSKKHSIVQITHNLHNLLFQNREYVYKILYQNDENDFQFYFDPNNRGVDGNFLGSKFEKPIDEFLENINFVCFWLTQEDVGHSREIFDKYIKRTLNSPFIASYLKFLSTVDSVATEGHFFPFLRNYARSQLALNLDNASFPKNAAEAFKISDASMSSEGL